MLPELLSPAGSFDAALAAFQYGADAVYLGLPRFSARADADNLSPDRIRVLLAYARSISPTRKVYATFNTVVRQDELREAAETLALLDDLAVDGVIVQDLGIAALVRKNFPRLALHASTQLAAHSLRGVRALKELGFCRVVLARELTLEETAHICKHSGVEIEVFVHGALCYAISGLCLFSSMTRGRSGNRGRCAYCCRGKYGSGYPFSMRDLALAPILDKVVATGAASLKIEGRMKSPLYVACVTDYYRRKLDGKLSPAEDAELVQDLQTVFSRPWTTLYAEERERPSEAVIDPLALGHRGAEIGRVERIFSDRGNWLRFASARAIERHDGLQVELPQGGRPFGFAVGALRKAGSRRNEIELPKGAKIEVLLPHDAPEIPVGAPVFCSASQHVKRKYEIHSVRESELPLGKPIDVRVKFTPSALFAEANGHTAEVPGNFSPAKQPERTIDAVRNAFVRMGGTNWRLADLQVDDAGLYAPLSHLNELRRNLLKSLGTTLKSLPEFTPVFFPKHSSLPKRVARIRAGQSIPRGFSLEELDEIIVDGTAEELMRWQPCGIPVRAALPMWSRGEEPAIDFASCERWEASDLAGLFRLREAGMEDITADWSLYAFNEAALAELARLGAKRIVLSPENDRANALALAKSGMAVELLAFQHTPLFISCTPPCGETGGLAATRRGELWTTTAQPFRIPPEEFPENATMRFDFSWSPAKQPQMNDPFVSGNWSGRLL